MSSKKIYDYRNIPFSSEQLFQSDFYTYANIDTLLAKCKANKDKVLNCRTIGILESLNGCFYLRDITFKSDAPKIIVSLDYLKSSLPSTIIPYMVQVFGTLQWMDKAVIFAKIVQVLDTASGLRLNEALKSITSYHLAKQLNYDE